MSPNLLPDPPIVVGWKGGSSLVPLLDSSFHYVSPSLCSGILSLSWTAALLCSVVSPSIHLVLARLPKILTFMCSVKYMLIEIQFQELRD